MWINKKKLEQATASQKSRSKRNQRINE